MSFYLDTSAVVPLLIEEVATARVETWFSNHDAQPKLISLWVMAETSAALSMKVRTGALKSDDRRQVIAAFDALAAGSFETVPITDEHFHQARNLALKAVGLRAGDALHLAIAASHNATVLTLDLGMAKAARDLGLPVETL